MTPTPPIVPPKFAYIGVPQDDFKAGLSGPARPCGWVSLLPAWPE
jgi:hypothetical protein